MPEDAQQGADYGRRRGPMWLASATVAVGVTLIALVLATQQSAPQPVASAETTTASASPPSTLSSTSSAAPAKSATQRPLLASRPVSISIPTIGVASAVFPIGKAQDGTLKVPQPGPDLDKAAWYKNSPTPGQPGPSVIEGHVDTDRGPSVFFRLGDLRPGDKIEVTRADNRVVTFTVKRLQIYPKERFPTELVYGGDLGTPTLRLITCSGFDNDIDTYTGNLLVFAELSDVRRT